MRYEWDEFENRENRRKHGISFDLAALVLEDENRIIVLGETDESGQLLWQATGAISVEPWIRLVAVVVHVYGEDDDGEETIRIISARAAEQRGVRGYQEEEVD